MGFSPYCLRIQNKKPKTMINTIFNFWDMLLDLIIPRACVVCGSRLGISEEVICTTCNLHMPRTYHSAKAKDNEMAKLFWVQIPIERAAALMHYEAHSKMSRIVYALKYGNHPEIGITIGRMMANEFDDNNFFDGIDCIIPMPISKGRKRDRGYNQSEEIAKGISELTHIEVKCNVVRRKVFAGSQTEKNKWERKDNVKGVFQLIKPEEIQNKHVLIVDDVVTTGSTILSLAKELMKAGDIKISVASIGFTHKR